MSIESRPKSPRPGKLWIIPLGVDDITAVTDTVISYEHNGVLHLAEPVGTVGGTGLASEIAQGE